MKLVNYKFNTIFSRILFFNFLLVIGVTVLPFSIFTNYFINNFNSQINQYNMQLVRMTQNYIDDTVIKKIVDFPNTYFSELDINYELTYPYYHDITDDAALITVINGRIRNILATYKFINAINIYYVDNNIIFSNSGVSFVGDESFPKKSRGYEQILDLLKNSYEPTMWLSDVTLFGQQESSPAVYIKSLPYSTSMENRKAVLAISFNSDFFYQFVDKAQLNQDETLFILDTDGSIIMSTDKSLINTKFDDANLKSYILNGSSGMLNQKYSGRQSIISFSKSEYNNWRYVSITSVEIYYQKSAQMKTIILVSLLLLLPLNIFLSAFFTRAAHKPLKKVLNNISNMVNNEGSEDNEYRMLENTFKGLREKVYELNNRLEENKPLIRHNTLLGMLKGTQGGIALAAQELVNIRFSGNRVFCFLLKFFFDEKLGAESRLMIAYNIIELFEKQNDVNLKSIVDDSDRLITIVNYNSDLKKEEIEDSLIRLLDSVLKIPYTICMGDAYDFSMDNIHNSYVKANETFRYTYLFDEKKLLLFSQIEARIGNNGAKPKNIMRLEEYIRAGDAASIASLMQTLVSEIKNSNYSIDAARNILMEVVTIVHLTISDLGFDENELLGCDIHNTFDEIDSISRFQPWIIDICCRVIIAMNTRSELIGKELKNKIKVYIEDNLYKDISLESAAEALYMSPGHLSRIFKNAFGANFTEYVVGIKMEEAVKLLRQNHFTVKEISNKLGYSSVQYFIQIFKGKYGYTPKLYQRTFSDKDSE